MISRSARSFGRLVISTPSASRRAIAQPVAFRYSACLFAQPLADCVRILNPVARALPAFFANLLPEDKLREAMEKHHAGSVRAGNDFDLLVALGSDLPGAVRVVPSDGTVARRANLSAPKPKARFSLAGVQMKLSVIKNTGKGGGLTLPLGDDQGSYIAKFPSTSFPGVSENEYANLALAEAIGSRSDEGSRAYRHARKADDTDPWYVCGLKPSGRDGDNAPSLARAPILLAHLHPFCQRASSTILSDGTSCTTWCSGAFSRETRRSVAGFFR